MKTKSGVRTWSLPAWRDRCVSVPPPEQLGAEKLYLCSRARAKSRRYRLQSFSVRERNKKSRLGLSARGGISAPPRRMHRWLAVRQNPQSYARRSLQC